MRRSKKVLVVGATGGTGRAVIDELIRAGHRPTAFSRNPDRLDYSPDELATIAGDVTRPADVERAVRGHDAVIVTLGITENPLRVRFFGPAHTALDVRSRGTRNVVAAMPKHRVHRLVVQSTYGVGRTRDKLRFADRLFFRAILKPQIDDTELQEAETRDGDLDWVLVQPVHLTDEDAGTPFASIGGDVKQWSVSRRTVARFLARAIDVSDFIGQSVAVSSATAPAMGHVPAHSGVVQAS